MRLSRSNKLLVTLFAFAFLAIYQHIVGVPLAVKEENVLSEQTESITQSVRQQAQITRVVDGDTFEVLLNTKKEKVRVIGINTPETVDPRRPVQCFGKEASDFAKQMLVGQEVLLESDATQSDKDKYKRLLRYVWLRDGTIDFGREMIAKGYANEYTYESPYKYQASYKQAEQNAREQKLGLWNDTSCIQKSS